MNILTILDKKRFLGVRFWEFGIRSLGRQLGVEVVARLLFCHPIKSTKGFFRYRHYLAENKEGVIPHMETNSYPHLVVMGAYCQKPREEDPCPAGRFNHRCHFIETLTVYPACGHCDLRRMAELAMLLGCRFYIMTSALNLLQDVFLPAISEKAFSHYLVMICPYAKELFLFPALVSGMKGWTLTIAKGSCQNYREFLLADKGHKPRQTHLSPIAHGSLLNIHERIKANSKGYRRLVPYKSFYVPSGETLMASKLELFSHEMMPVTFQCSR